MSAFNMAALQSAVHQGIPTRASMEKKLNIFLENYAQQAESQGRYEKAEQVRKLSIPRFPWSE